MVKNIILFFIILNIISSNETYGANLYLEFFTRPVEADNIIFQTPEEYKGKFFFIKDRKILLFDKERILNPIEILIGSDAISEIVKNSNFLFCSDDSKIIEISRFGVEKKIDIPFPCISPPRKFKNKIYSVDLKSNVCLTSESEQKCIKLKEEKFGEIKLISLSSPKILQFKNQILVPYENELFAISDDLRTRYKMVEFENKDFINSTEIIGDRLYISTQKKIVIFEISSENDILKVKQIFNFETKDKIIGADFDDEKIAFTYEKGFGIIKNGKTFLKPIRGLIDISYPLIHKNNILFIGQFGEKVGRIFGPRKNSLVLVSIKENGEPAIKREYIIHSFARKIKNSGNNLYFLTEDSTLYVFRLFSGIYFPNL